MKLVFWSLGHSARKGEELFLRAVEAEKIRHESLDPDSVEKLQNFESVIITYFVMVTTGNKFQVKRVGEQYSKL